MREPASGAFDVTVAPGEDAQAAVGRCPPKGCVLLLPGTHDGPLAQLPVEEVHVFGRGRRRPDGVFMQVCARAGAIESIFSPPLRCERG